jgi:hypothetical protein
VACLAAMTLAAAVGFYFLALAIQDWPRWSRGTEQATVEAMQRRSHALSVAADVHPRSCYVAEVPLADEGAG